MGLVNILTLVLVHSCAPDLLLDLRAPTRCCLTNRTFTPHHESKLLQGRLQSLDWTSGLD